MNRKVNASLCSYVALWIGLNSEDFLTQRNTKDEEAKLCKYIGSRLGQ